MLGLTSSSLTKLEQVDGNESEVQQEEGHVEESEHTEEEERRLVRKLDRRILPIACLLYLCAYLDRSNLGNARLQGLPEDVLGGDRTGELFDWVVSVFYISYILFQIPATIISKLFPPSVWMACAAIGWGSASTLMATASSFGALVVCRLLIGVFEAGFGPSLPLYLSYFFTKSEMGLRMAYWFAFATVAGSIGGFIAFGIQNIQTSIAHWRLLFVVEGIPPIMLGVLTIFILPNRPESTSFLNERERKIALARMNRATRGDVGATVNKAHIALAFQDWRVYTGGVIYFGLNCALASISAFLPTIITTFGHTPALAQLLTVPPYVTASVVLISFSWASDVLQSRGLFMTIASCISGVGYLILLNVTTNMNVRYFATFCITSGTYTTIGITIAWFAHNLGSETKKATGMPIFMAIGQCGSILGSHIFPKAEGPAYTIHYAAKDSRAANHPLVSCFLAFLAAGCSAFLSMSYRRENAYRDRVHGKVDPLAPVDTRELADKAPEFRYMP
ncbi:MFS general substrate transporter [Coprinopsis marcescibilis]|uniref:MFS general substrate transporter n=1 Tax=Coprinopsis marcescibilis TaxID=230819 RepID=A0A5C3KL01_COPMA|nr:MFS general substrate transporter [Coprinopsis marcescibilis]